MNRYIKFILSEENDYLIEKHPNAFLLLMLIVRRARRISGKPDGLKIGECLIGDYKRAGIETRSKYRTALEILKKRGHIEIMDGNTTTGTKVKLINLDLWEECYE